MKSTVQSLINTGGDDLRALADVQTDVPAPTQGVTEGLSTHGRAKLHVVVGNKDAAGTLDVLIYGKHTMTGKWFLFEEASPGVAFETDGTWSIPAGVETHCRVIEICGVERVAVEVANSSGLTLGADIWLGTVGGFSPADR